MNDLTQHLLLFGAVLFTLGFIGFLTRRSIILMFLSLELMLAGVSVNLIAFSREHHNYQGQVMAIMVLTVAACEAAIALAMVVSLYRRKATLDVHVWAELTENPTVPAAEVEERFVEQETSLPKLTPAGLDPALQPVPFTLGQEGWQSADRRTHDKEPVNHA